MRLAVLAVLLGALAARALAQAPPPPTKPSSFAPHLHGGAKIYGTPIQPRILGHTKRKPRKPAAGGTQR